jgi:16S rRNA (cytidine1402-2'-O)-methyltransferase
MFDLVRALLETKTIAMVSDAGMPCISDPGWKLVNRVRNSMPDVPIEVVGGPSSVGVLALQASVCAQGPHLSGRFEGFSSLSTGNFEEKNREMQHQKMKEFSIHYINANKLKGRLLELEQAFGGQQRIILNNELTKKYERRFEGSIAELLDKMDQPEFRPVGEISYLLYPHPQEAPQQEKKELNEVEH